MKMEQCSETSAYKIQTPGNYPEESIQQLSTCFEQTCGHHREIQIYQYDIWCMSLCISDRLNAGLDGIKDCMLDFQLYRVAYTRCSIDAIDSPDDEHMAARNM